MRTRLVKYIPPLLLRPLLGIMHRHNRNIASSIRLLDVGFERASSRRHAVVDQNNGVGVNLHDGDEGLKEADAVFVGPVPEDVSEHEGDDVAGGGGGLRFEHVALVEFDAGLKGWGEGLLALGEEGLGDVLDFEGEGGELGGEGGGEVAVAAADVDDQVAVRLLVGFEPVAE
jgi:hypothetical protein